MLHAPALGAIAACSCSSRSIVATRGCVRILGGPFGRQGREAAGAIPAVRLFRLLALHMVAPSELHGRHMQMLCRSQARLECSNTVHGMQLVILLPPR